MPYWKQDFPQQPPPELDYNQALTIAFQNVLNSFQVLEFESSAIPGIGPRSTGKVTENRFIGNLNILFYMIQEPDYDDDFKKQIDGLELNDDHWKIWNAIVGLFQRGKIFKTKGTGNKGHL